MADTTAAKIADYIISLSHQHGDPITNLKLQKLLYYSQAWHLALYNKPLFDADFEAWVHGPVQPQVYRKYKKYAWTPIPKNPDPNELGLTSHIQKHINEVMAVYGILTAWELERTTHQEMPWIKARHGLASDEPSNAIISQSDMRQFYKAMANDDKEKPSKANRNKNTK